MKTNRQYPVRRVVCMLLLAAGALLVAAGCSSSASGGSSCETDADCSVGTVCTAQGVCESGVGCQFCTETQICYTEDVPEGECSVPECGPNADGRSCSDGESCQNGKCIDGSSTCKDDRQCPEGMVCDVLGKCVEPGDAGSDPNPDPDVGMTSDTGTDGGGQEGMDAGVDGGGNTCPSGGPSDCPPGHSPEATMWSTQYCACVQCLSDSDCGDGKSCRNGTCQEECAQSCSSSGGSTNCPSDTPYCLSGCCVECVGNADCSGDKVCIDGGCGQTPSDCTTEGCPDGYTCNSSTGQCEQQQSNQECTRNDPSCPPGETCNTNTNTCEPPTGGGGSCGMCGQNCTCPGNLTCSANFACTGCGSRFFVFDTSYHCPQGQTCLALTKPTGIDPSHVCASFN